jgi:hypothetical protein
MDTAFACDVCGKVLFDGTTRVCRWQTAKLEFIPNGAHGPLPIFMVKCPQCKPRRFQRVDVPAMIAAARSQWDAIRGPMRGGTHVTD